MLTLFRIGGILLKVIYINMTGMLTYYNHGSYKKLGTIGRI